MKQRRGVGKAYALVLLLVFTVSALSLTCATMAKYVGGGSLTASGRVAQWNVAFGTTTTDQVNNTIFYISTSSITKKRYFRVNNNSQVAASITPKAFYTNNLTSTPTPATAWAYSTIAIDSASGEISRDTPTLEIKLQPGGYVIYSIVNSTTTPTASVTGTPSSGNNETYKVQLLVDAVQVD